ncbi:hypothetical protein HYH38_16120 [Clostridium botulinum]|uniref:Uncharacterized protein n=1 Tax=Clostridium botulinum TaxID=1491 RepID=A0A126JIM9_CLOBO|nr:hypothetical protein [Clostridium botulinum]ALT05452.1 hypothetical protein [Clostridium botulinum]ALT05550.1 hypothetical protein [Clostridium botulinum]MBY6810990.1 hypothetical protein [Clostridium botulinum]MBY6818467.1 hypothetical protein [Clostridium botulinum]MBY6824458.1 hypothetical protein [Clostridium botulinum]
MIREISKFLDDLIKEGYEISLNTQEGDMLITATDNNVTHKDYKFSFFNNILSHVVCLTYRKILEDNSKIKYINLENQEIRSTSKFLICGNMLKMSYKIENLGEKDEDGDIDLDKEPYLLEKGDEYIRNTEDIVTILKNNFTKEQLKNVSAK